VLRGAGVLVLLLAIACVWIGKNCDPVGLIVLGSGGLVSFLIGRHILSSTTRSSAVTARSHLPDGAALREVDKTSK